MASLTTRAGKGSPLTNNELDANFNNLNTEVTPARPTIRPSLSLDFANSKSVDSRITFTRASSATRYDANGVLQKVVNDQPRIDFDPSTGECKGLLVEEQRTNLFTDSDKANSTSWQGTSGGGYGALDRNTYTVAPDGSLAYKIHSISTCSTWSQPVTIGTGIYTMSFYAKLGAGSPALQRWLTGITYTVLSELTAIQTLSNGWVRYAVTFNVTVGGTGNFGVHVGCWNTAPAGGQPDWYYYWGFQLEAGSFPTSYIPSATTFTSRASSASYFDSTGTLRYAGVNQPRYGYCYDTASGKWVSQGLVLEAAATNILPDSTFGTTWWGSNNIAAKVVGATTAPDGTQTAVKYIADTNPGSHWWRIVNPSWTTGVYTMSFYVKAAEQTAIYISTNGSAGMYFSTTTGQVSGSAGSDYLYSSAQQLANGWWRVSMTINRTVGDSFILYAVGGGSTSFSGDGSSGIYVWGAQLEAGYVATSYVPSIGASATRAADVSSSAQTTRAREYAAISGSNFTSWFNQSAGTLYADVSPFYVYSGAGYVYPKTVTFVGSDANTDSVGLYRGTGSGYNYYGGLVYTSGASYYDQSIFPSTNDVRCAIGYATNDVSHSVNGVIAPTDTTVVLPKLQELRIFGDGTYQSMQSGYVRKVSYFPRRLTNAQLQALTA